MNINIGNRIGLILMAASIVACGGGGGGGGGGGTGGGGVVTPPTRTLTGVSVSGNNTVTAGQTAQFQANATFSDGATESVTTSATWTSDNNSVATVNGSGLATGVAAGSTQIRAAHQNMSGSAALQVNAPAVTAPVASFVVTGPSGNNVCRLMVGSGGDFDCTFDGSASTGGSGGAVVRWTWRWDVLADSGGPVSRDVPTFRLIDQCGFFTGGQVNNTSVQMIVKLVVRNAAGVDSAEVRNSQVTLVHNDQCGF